MAPSSVRRETTRLHQACLNCRRKKVRCPGEKPACSSCNRLQQVCAYRNKSREPRINQALEDRLTNLEDKLDLVISGNKSSYDAIRDLSVAEGDLVSHTTPQSQVSPLSSSLGTGFSNSIAITAKAMDIYFERCHRQPIWCFDRDEIGELQHLDNQLGCAILALTSHFVSGQENSQQHLGNARSLIMLRVANGSVSLETIESLCIVSYTMFLDGNLLLGRFHLGLAMQLCKAALLDVASTYNNERALTERKKRVFWSLQHLEQFYGDQCGLLSISTETWRAVEPRDDEEIHLSEQLIPNAPPLPKEDTYQSSPADNGMWNYTIQLGWIWSKVRNFVSNCANNQLQEPWRADSIYAQIVSDLMAAENRMPMWHRYDSVKFFERDPEELRTNRAYWRPWLKNQFTYHAVQTLLNHPFLYAAASQRNKKLATLNTFWRRCSELVLLHATWIVRLADMVLDRQVELSDPAFGHAAAIAATVHLYYCCSADLKLKQKSIVDLEKCRKFLKHFTTFSNDCAVLEKKLDQTIRIASGSSEADLESWTPSTIYLSTQLMWDILHTACSNQPQASSGEGLLDSSLAFEDVQCNKHESILKIACTDSPVVIVNTADGGQSAPMMSMSVTSAKLSYPGMATPNNIEGPLNDISGIYNPWLWFDKPQVTIMNGHDFQDGFPVGVENSAWWDFGNL